MKKICKTLCLALALSMLLMMFTGCEKKPGLYAWYGGRMDVDTVMTIHVDGGEGKKFEEGAMTLEDLVAYAKANGEPKQTSGKQELYEAIVNMYC